MSDVIRDPVDAAIDRVAARLVSVKDDPDAVLRIVASLPARRAHAWWSWSSWPLQAAAFASALMAIVYLRVTNDEVRMTGQTGRPVAILVARPMDAITALRQSARRAEVVETSTSVARTLGAAHVSDSGVAASQSFELAPIVALDSLTLPTLQTTAPLTTIEPATVAPISLSELPLTTEAPPPFSKE